LKLREMVSHTVPARSPADSNWITCVTANDTALYIGDSSGQLTEMDLVAVRNRKQATIR